LVKTILDQPSGGRSIEVLVADDGSVDDTASVARDAGASVISIGVQAGNPAAARNLAAGAAGGDVLLFLDGDCLPESGWLAKHLEAQDRGHAIVGGALTLPDGLRWTARCDYYASAYHVHPDRSAGPVPNHTPANLSVRRDLFRSTGGFSERFPVADGHEELAWQAAALARGFRPYFEPAARAQHGNRPGLGNLFRRSYRWGYSALEAKSTSGAARLPFLYRFPVVTILLAYPMALLETGYIAAQWLRVKRFQVIQFIPLILLSRIVYATAFMIGGLKWLMRPADAAGTRPRWR
jgi:GT2 family glycosyltransferase